MAWWYLHLWWYLFWQCIEYEYEYVSLLRLGWPWLNIMLEYSFKATLIANTRCTNLKLIEARVLLRRTAKNTLNIAKGTTDPRHWVLCFIQHLYFKAEASTSFEILVQLQLSFVWQRAEMHRTTLTNPCKNLEKSMYQFWQIHVTTWGNPYIKFDKSM